MHRPETEGAGLRGGDPLIGGLCQRLVDALGVLGPLVLLVAALGKVLAGSPLDVAVPGAGIRTLSFAWIVAIACMEAAPFAFVLCRRVVLANTMAAFCFTLFLIYAIIIRRSTSPPDCSCFGLWSDYLGTLNEAGLMLVRNGVLLTMPVAYLVAVAITRGRGRVKGTRPDPATA